jgi:hypothetical protein
MPRPTSGLGVSSDHERSPGNGGEDDDDQDDPNRPMAAGRRYEQLVLGHGSRCARKEDL